MSAIVQVDQQQTDKQIETLMRDFIATRKGEEVTALDLQNRMLKIWGIRIHYLYFLHLLKMIENYGMVSKTETVTQVIEEEKRYEIFDVYIIN